MSCKVSQATDVSLDSCLRRNDDREDGRENIRQLRWRCRRGTREMDLLLLRFLERDYPRLDAREQSLFGALLDETDPDLYAWISGQSEPSNPDYLPIIGKINASRPI